MDGGRSKASLLERKDAQHRARMAAAEDRAVRNTRPGNIFHQYPDAKLPVTVRKRRRQESRRMKQAHPGRKKTRTLSDVLSGTGLRKRHEQRQEEEARKVYDAQPESSASQRANSPAARRRMKEQEGLAFPGGN
jgi:hypothetical protein